MFTSISSEVTTRTFQATCHCRGSTLSFTVPTCSLPIPVHFCHCGICRHTSGTLFTAGATVPEPNIDLSTLIPYKSSEHMTRWFCSTCGMCLLGNFHLGDTTKWFVPAPPVDAEEKVWHFAAHLYVGSTADGGLATLMTQIGGKEIELWEELAGRSALWHPAESRLKTRLDMLEPDDQLHARCHCGGIEFFVSRPTGDETSTEVDMNGVRKYKEKWPAMHEICTLFRPTISSFVVSWFFPSRNQITLVGGSPYPENGIFGTAKAYKSSTGVERTFCSRCGAIVSDVTYERSHMVGIAVGLIDTKDVRAEDWLEWKTYKLAREEDAIWRSATDALKRGLQSNA